MNREELEAIRGRCTSATTGPWEAIGKEGLVKGCRCGSCYERNLGHWVVSSVSMDDHEAENDAKFIAHAREDVPALLAEVYRLQAVEREITTALVVKNLEIGKLRDALRVAEEAADACIKELRTLQFTDEGAWDAHCQRHQDELKRAVNDAYKRARDAYLRAYRCQATKPHQSDEEAFLEIAAEILHERGLKE